MSRYIKQDSKPLTTRVVTLLYRAPEILLGMKNYTEKVDVWSLGCVFAEMYSRIPLFYTAKDPVNLMEQILMLMGSPDKEYWPELEDLPLYNQIFVKKEFKKGLSNHMFKMKTCIDELGLDLLSKMLQINPDRRISVHEALNHPFFTSEPLPCKAEDMPKIEKESHEYNIRQAI